jgi:DNA mismatch endonuclease Vsr
MERYLRLKLPSGRFLHVEASRSRTMSAIRSKHAKTTELALRHALMRAGVKGWRLHPADVPASPDVFFPKERLAIFVDGCFWHGCSKCGHIPKTRRAFWRAKIERNRARDRAAIRRLKKLQLRSIRIWEHDLKSPESTVRALRRIQRALRF